MPAMRSREASHSQKNLGSSPSLCHLKSTIAAAAALSLCFRVSPSQISSRRFPHALLLVRSLSRLFSCGKMLQSSWPSLCATFLILFLVVAIVLSFSDLFVVFFHRLMSCTFWQVPSSSSHALLSTHCSNLLFGCWVTLFVLSLSHPSPLAQIRMPTSCFSLLHTRCSIKYVTKSLIELRIEVIM
jgi:hypothetical protein